jgi:NitT/TauT family transport system permease protein
MRGLVVPVLVVVLAQAAAMIWGIKSDMLAAPSTIALAGWRAAVDGTLWTATGQTLGAALTALGIGGGLGLVCGILLGLFRPLARLFTISVEAVRPVPSVALIPIALLVFGFGFRMEVSVTAFACFWPMLIMGQAAVAGIQPRLLEVGRALRMSFPARAWKIVLPAALPRLFVGLRLAAGIALIVAVTVEIVANPLGLGYMLMIAQQSLHPGLMFAALLWVGIIGWALNGVLLFAQRRLFGWVAEEHAG